MRADTIPKSLHFKNVIQKCDAYLFRGYMHK